MGEKDTHLPVHLTTVEFQFFKTSIGNKIGLKNWVVQKIGDKITVFD